MILQPTPAKGINLLHDRAMDGYRGTGITVNARGIEEFSAMVSVPSAGWFVVARIPTADAFAAIARTKTYVLRSSLFTLLLMVVLVAGLSWWALKPLFAAARQADAMTRGEAPLEPLRVARNDEVGHLTAAFNRLLIKLANSQAELARMAHHDSLTGLPNRRLLADRLRQGLARARRNRTQIALLAMDLDGFKPINDTLGHEAGDEALRVLAERFAGALRKSDTLARVGGDEFVLLAADLLGGPEDVANGAKAIASKIIDIASQPVMLNGAQASLRVSIGIAIGGGPCSPEQLLNAADQAMYEAKRSGGGRCVFAQGVEAMVLDSNSR
jgi:diguanylate cyclase (GGDEF)-like protein